MPGAESVRTPPAVFGLVDRVVTVAVLLDWVPAAVFGEPLSGVSLTKFVVAPAIMLDFLLRPSSYLRGRPLILTATFASCVLVGVGGGVAEGQVTISRFLAVLPNIPVFAFFVRRRSSRETLQVLRTCYWSALLAPVFIGLAAIGLVEPSMEVRTDEVQRLMAGASWSTIGLYMVVIAASLGGLLLHPRLKNLSVKMTIAWLSVAGSAMAIMVSGQRASAIGYALSMAVAVVVITHRRHWRGFLIVASTAIAALVVGILAGDFVWQRASTLVFRFSELSQGTESAQIRWEQYAVWYQDLVTQHSVIGSGESSVISAVGTVPHFILGEAYYSGGLLLMLAMLVGFLAGGRSLIMKAFREPSGTDVDAMLLATWVGFLLVLCLHPGLSTRLLYLFGGLWLASPGIQSYVRAS